MTVEQATLAAALLTLAATLFFGVRSERWSRGLENKREDRERRRSVVIAMVQPIGQGNITGRLSVDVTVGLGYSFRSAVLVATTEDGREAGRSSARDLDGAGLAGFDVPLLPPVETGTVLLLSLRDEHGGEITGQRRRV